MAQVATEPVGGEGEIGTGPGGEPSRRIVGRSPWELFRRQRLSVRAIFEFNDLAEYRLRDALRDWWSLFPDERHSRWLYRIDPRRLSTGARIDFRIVASDAESELFTAQTPQATVTEADEACHESDR